MKQHTHIGVYGVLLYENKILLIKKARGPYKGKWDLPGGSIEFGEEPYDALLREFNEETGLTDLEGVIHNSISHSLNYINEESELENLHHIGIIYNVKLKNENYSLKSQGDGQDSLGASWIKIDDVQNVPHTPFVKCILNL